MADDRDSGRASPTAGSGAPTRGSISKQIGPYKILEQIGEGGFGVVYLAEQTEPVRRRVALKVIKVGMDTKAVVARFEAERQALALMDHPGVAKVLDAGATDTGRPYFIMEHVAGVPITEHCDRHRLSIDERLQLFIPVCEAVQHAHQKGIIHRDLKPSNILVSAREGGRVPKVIDFGVAKALHQRLSEKTLFTEQGQLIGTPEYMSPEQAEMTAQDIDTRSDIYSLGVLLYELLTGERPFSSEAIRRAGLAEIQRIIREEDPPKPSTRLSGLGDASTAHARCRRADPRTLTRSLRGDLDWIVMKCLEKDRSRRYETANGLAADLRRHLAHEPVVAGPPSATYRLGKFVRRHRIGVTAAAAVLFALVAGITGTTWGLISAVKARNAEQVATAAAKEQARIAAEMVEFQASQLSGIDVPLMAVRLRRDIVDRVRAGLAESGIGAEETVARAGAFEEALAQANFTDVALATLEENVFDRALVTVDEDFGEQPLVRASLLQTVAETLTTLGLLDRAARPQAEALAIRRRMLGDTHPDTLESINGWAYLLQRQGKLAEAEPGFREALEGRRRILGDEHPRTLVSINNMGIVLQLQGKLSEAEPYYREALEGHRRVLGDEHPRTLSSINNMGFLLQYQGKLAEAEPYYRQALEGRRRVLGDEHPGTLTTIDNMGMLLQGQGKLAEAEPFQREAVETRRRILGEAHADTLVSVNNMGMLLQSQGKLDEAGTYYREALEGSRRALGDEHPQTLSLINNVGFLLQRQGKLADAEPHYRDALEGRRAALGDGHPRTLASINNMGSLLNARRRYTESEPLLRESLETGRTVLGADHWRMSEARSLLGESLAGQDRFDEAEPLLLEGYAGLDASLPPRRRPQKLPPAIKRLVKLYEVSGRPDEATRWRAKLAEIVAALAE